MYTYGITGTSINEFQDVNISSPSEYQTLEFNGTEWVNTHASVATYVRNADSVALPVGTVVYLFGATGDHATVKRADNDSDATSSKTVGIVASASIAPNENGIVVTRGYVDGINLSSGYASGDILWLGEDGGFTKTKPSAPEHLVFVGVVVRATNNGIIYVAVQNGYEIDELHDVSTTTPALGDSLEYNGTLWVNRARRPNPLALQTPVTTRKYLPLTVVGAIPGANIGSCAVITFKQACDITALSVYLNATYTGATTYDYRLGIYADSNGAPGSLLADGGTVSIAQNATAGYKTITLGSAVSVAANTPVWLVCAAGHSGTVPTLIGYGGHTQPYSDYGLSSATHSQAACLAYQTGPATALPATFSLASPETQPVGVAVYATVTIP